MDQHVDYFSLYKIISYSYLFNSFNNQTSSSWASIVVWYSSPWTMIASMCLNICIYRCMRMSTYIILFIYIERDKIIDLLRLWTKEKNLLIHTYTYSFLLPTWNFIHLLSTTLTPTIHTPMVRNQNICAPPTQYL